MKTIGIGIIIGILFTAGVQYLRVDYFSSLFAGTTMECLDISKEYQVDIYWSMETWNFDFNWKCKSIEEALEEISK